MKIVARAETKPKRARIDTAGVQIAEVVLHRSGQCRVEGGQYVGARHRPGADPGRELIQPVTAIVGRFETLVAGITQERKRGVSRRTQPACRIDPHEALSCR